jgi:hypothetical protein
MRLNIRGSSYPLVTFPDDLGTPELAASELESALVEVAKRAVTFA